MKNHRKHMDYDLGRKICQDLRSGYRSAIIELYNRYAHFFAAFANRRLFDKDPHAIESVLSTFWLELLSGKAICRYNGRASLQTYLTIILNRRIIDANRKFARQHNEAALTDVNPAGFQCDSQHNPETEIIGEEQRKLIQKALVQLFDQFPRDANLIRLNLEGLTYEQMANRELNGNSSDPQELKRRVEAIKKQFTRKETGSMAKFKNVLTRCLDTDGLDYRELFNR